MKIERIRAVAIKVICVAVKHHGHAFGTLGTLATAVVRKLTNDFSLRRANLTHPVSHVF